MYIGIDIVTYLDIGTYIFKILFEVFSKIIIKNNFWNPSLKWKYGLRLISILRINFHAFHILIILFKNSRLLLKYFADVIYLNFKIFWQIIKF